jgi:hypothetical protein
MPEIHWAMESHVDELACQLGLDPLHVRRLNGLTEGSELPTRGRLHASGLLQCLDRVAGPWTGANQWRRPAGLTPASRLGRCAKAGLRSLPRVKRSDRIHSRISSSTVQASKID